MPIVPRLSHQAQMELRLDNDRLTAMALATIEEVAAHCKYTPQAKTRALAMVLAYLASRMHSDAGRFPFDSFWKSIDWAEPIGRDTNVQAAVNGIYRALLVDRGADRREMFEQRAREMAGAVQREPQIRATRPPLS